MILVPDDPIVNIPNLEPELKPNSAFQKELECFFSDWEVLVLIYGLFIILIIKILNVVVSGLWGKPKQLSQVCVLVTFYLINLPDKQVKEVWLVIIKGTKDPLVKNVIYSEYMPSFIVLIIIILHLLEDLLLQVEERIPMVTVIAFAVIFWALRVLRLEDFLLLRRLTVRHAAVGFDHVVIHLRLQIVVC